MLLSFTVRNYRSFRDEVTLDLNSSSIKGLEENVAYLPNGARILKSAVIYGANSSGKSNLLTAMIFVKKLVLNSSKNSQANENIDVESFRLNSRTEGRPSYFEVIFFHQGIKYRYNLSVDKMVVHTENLFYTKVNKEYTYFTRENGKINIDEKFIEGFGLESKTRENALFLSVVAQWNGEISMSLLNWFSNFKYINDTNKQFHQDYTAKLLIQDENYRNWITKFLANGDLGFSELTMEKMNLGELENIPKEIRDIILGENKGGTTIRTHHKKYDENTEEVGQVLFDLNKHESLGTRKYFSISGLIVEALAMGKVLIMDEFDARLHPNLSASIIRLFNSRLNNPKNAQLIFVTHNTNLLSKDNFRRDQIILAKKDPKFGFTKMNPLIDEKARIDEAYEKNYLKGEYGAIPDTKNQLNLFDNLA